MVKKRILSVMMAVLLVAVLAAGCGKNDSAEETENKEATDTAAEQEPEKKDTYKISALLYSRGFEFMVALDQGIQDKCKEYGIEVEAVSYTHLF